MNDSRRAADPEVGEIQAQVTPDTKTASRSEDSVRRLALFLEVDPKAVEANIPNAMQLVLCRLPWESRLRRSRDDMLLADIRYLLDDMESDDIRRPRLRYLLEHAERRARL